MSNRSPRYGLVRSAVAALATAGLAASALVLSAGTANAADTLAAAAAQSGRYFGDNQ